MTEHDWTLLNAYADRELGQGETAVLTARLARDPAFAGELLRIRRLKARLAGLRAPERPPRRAAALGAWRPTAVAASLVIAALIACFTILGPIGTGPAGERISVLALHSEFSSLPSPDLARTAAAGPDIPPPDLSASNLRLFAARRVAASGTAAIGYHYRGPNGCRVTLVIGPALELPDAALARQWPIGERTAVLVADGMDPRRFAAVAAYAEAATRGPDPAERLRIALVERTASSRPCA